MSDVGGVDQAPQDVVVEVVEAEGDALQEPDPCKDPNHLELTQSNFQGPVQTPPWAGSTTAAVPWVTATVALRGSTASMTATVSPPRRRHWQHSRPSVRTCSMTRRAIMTLTRPPTFTPSNPHGRARPHGVAVSPSRLMAAGTTSPIPWFTGRRRRRGRPSQVG
ncbi:hypothetical protein FE382_11285 [Corynebacterium diphtheriae]|nr:hypothetical protein FE382_11285 [Corynebacterium diphtheriae]